MRPIDGRLEILADSGVRRGADRARFLALGAGMPVGRAPLYGVAIGGAAGASDILANELRVTMGMLGAPALTDLANTRFGWPCFVLTQAGSRLAWAGLKVSAPQWTSLKPPLQFWGWGIELLFCYRSNKVTDETALLSDIAVPAIAAPEAVRLEPFARSAVDLMLQCSIGSRFTGESGDS